MKTKTKTTDSKAVAEYKKELKKVPFPFDIVGDGMMKGLPHKEIADKIGQNVLRVQHIMKVMKKNKEHLTLFEIVLNK